MEFILGCNYWASNAGADMWRDFDESVVKDDIRVLAENGVTHMRVFPNWRDFQPVMPRFAVHGAFNDFCAEGDVDFDNPYYLDNTMLERFDKLLDACDEYGIKVIVGLVTGWMSGRLYTPSALYGKNVITDPTAIYFEQLFIRGFVARFKSRDTIFAWDLGNECNCMGSATRIEAAHWTASVSNAIRAEDNTRMIISGMHGLGVTRDTSWRVQDQATWTDMLTIHPYPYWGAYTRNDKLLAKRTTLQATAQNKFYAECGGIPCLAEEIGTMGPMFSSETAAADFLRANIFTLWSNDSTGFMWWCAHEQTMLTAFPYSENMVEVELGLLRPDKTPKPFMLEIKKFKEFLDTLDFDLPKATTDAVCILTRDTRQWGLCLTSYILATQAGLNIRFCYADDGIPEADTYLLPSVNGNAVMAAKIYKDLRCRVANGAHLYISMDNGVLSEFESLTGLRITDSFEAPENKCFELNGEKFNFSTNRTYLFESVGAKVTAYDCCGNPVLAENEYGKGRVTYLNFPLEENLIDGHNAFDKGDFKIYKHIFADELAKIPVKIVGNVFSTLHESGDTVYAVAVNHSENAEKISVNAPGYEISRVIYGSADTVKAFDAAVIELKKK